jgi:hypothetical protein
MIRFLRKTREYLATKGDFRKYILYTIGEVALIVIGILIAISIDGWNEGRKELAREQEILLQLKKDYNTNLAQLNEKIKMRESIINACETLLDAIDAPLQSNPDTVINQLSFLLMDPTFDPIQDNLINSGNIRLIRNPQLKRVLTNWTSDVAEVQDIEKGWQKLLIETVVPIYIELGISRDAVNSFWSSTDWYLDKQASHSILLKKSKVPPRVNEVLRDPKLEGLLSAAVLYNYSGNIQSYTLRSRVLEILELLEKEIAAS